jgi:hypothetical protein
MNRKENETGFTISGQIETWLIDITITNEAQKLESLFHRTCPFNTALKA